MDKAWLDKDFFYEKIMELIRKTSTTLPPDVLNALQNAYNKEENESIAKSVLDTILKSAQLSRENQVPICQDTGLPSFFIDLPKGEDPEFFESIIKEAVSQNVKDAILRPNAVNSITGENPGTCVGEGIPYFYYHFWDKDYIRIGLLLKGGGSENVSAQYSLPYSPLKAGRDLDGVRKVVLDAIFKAQGKGCAPGTVGVCIGGDRAAGYSAAKKTLLRKLDDENPDKELAELEKRILEEANQLGIGPMGLGGKTTILGVKITYLYRHPASFFVSIAYMCWAYRRGVLTIKKNGEVSYD